MSPPNDTADLIEDTLPDIADAVPARRAPDRELAICDFRDIDARLAVSHGPPDTSRVWIQLHSSSTSLHLTLAEGVARKLHERLGLVLQRFRLVRNGIL